MDPEDAHLAIERHATSKIAKPEDLGAIRTLGFRGEALPSIASVSHFVLRTRARGSASGTEIRVNGGTVASEREVGAPEGTAIEVADLFYNLPARQKFLKSDSAEATQISRIVTQMALGYPEVGFTLTSGGASPASGHGRKLLECPPANGPGERFFQLFGERLDLLEVRKEAGGIQIHGYIASLGEQGPVRGAQNVFVNRRIVRDRTIAHAISDAYSVATIKERSPEVHLFIRIPPDRVDVNVHPTKGGSAVPRAIAGARSAAPGARRGARAGQGARAAVHAVRAASVRAASDVHSRCARGRHRRQPVDARTTRPLA
jgi:DNA mismatch repair protein MutL